jgi:hypothetical protein
MGIKIFLHFFLTMFDRARPGFLIEALGDAKALNTILRERANEMGPRECRRGPYVVRRCNP